MGGIISKARKLTKIRRTGKFLAVILTAVCLTGATFIPVAYAAEEEQVVLTVRQVLTGNHTSILSDRAFVYRLKPKSTGAPMPASRSYGDYEFTITGSAEQPVGPIIFKTAGAYVYELSCVTGEEHGYIYDRQVYTIEIYVTNELTSSVIVYNNAGVKARALRYEHGLMLFPSDPGIMVDPPVVKTVSGNPASDSIFTFKLTAENPLSPMPEGSIDGVKTVQITGSGSAEFGTWPYTVEGIYFYAVSEVNSGDINYTYDNAVYTITDTVRAEDSQLVVSRVVTNSSNKQVLSMMFINTYKGGDGTAHTPTPTPTPVPTQSPATKPASPPEEPKNPPVPLDPGLLPFKHDDNGSVFEPTPDPLGEWRFEDGEWIFMEFPPDPQPGKGPKTGDEFQVVLNLVLFCAAVFAAFGSTIYLISGKKRGKVKE